jgi:hypothetical protein
MAMVSPSDSASVSLPAEGGPPIRKSSGSLPSIAWKDMAGAGNISSARLAALDP